MITKGWEIFIHGAIVRAVKMAESVSNVASYVMVLCVILF
jgi:hypothetical protein